MRVVLWICIVLAGPGHLAAAQETPPPALAGDAKPTFEVATIKPSQGDEHRAFFVNGIRLQTTATSLTDLMSFGYSVHALQVTGGPEWARSDKWDVVIEPNATGRPSTAQMRVIVQQLLADRFQLKVHHASKDLEVYAVVPSKRGARLTPTTAKEAASNTAQGAAGPGMMMAKNATLPEFANLMNRYLQLEWPVVDDTHIAGKYDFELRWIPETGTAAQPPVKDDPPVAPDLFAAMDEQLGLELIARKEPTDVLVIDGVRRPSEN
ncbi:MAG TPA: TIGR03435 family protein [Acidobacteriaceae bacterium]|nr:TIGR03435 family protein [Acidobacteriaceae bacterium]